MSEVVNPEKDLPPPPSAPPPVPLEPPPEYLSQGLGLLKNADRWNIVQFSTAGANFAYDAIKAEINLQYSSAVDLYTSALSKLVKALKHEKRDNIQNILKMKINEYFKRIERIKIFLSGETLPLPEAPSSLLKGLNDLELETKESIIINSTNNDEIDEILSSTYPIHEQHIDNLRPNLHRLTSRDHLSSGLTFIEDAIDADKKGNYHEALILYKQGLDNWLKGVKDEPSEHLRETTLSRISKYLKRAEEIDILIREEESKE